MVQFLGEELGIGPASSELVYTGEGFCVVLSFFVSFQGEVKLLLEQICFQGDSLENFELWRRVTSASLIKLEPGSLKPQFLEKQLIGTAPAVC